jgi:acyl-CoA reductase-like NAD-dependent aldehyde dehydrogenase
LYVLLRPMRGFSSPDWFGSMAETDSLDFLIAVQGAIKRCRESAAQTSDTKLASKLYRIADEIEQRVRELDRLELSADI